MKDITVLCSKVFCQPQGFINLRPMAGHWFFQYTILEDGKMISSSSGETAKEIGRAIAESCVLKGQRVDRSKVFNVEYDHLEKTPVTSKGGENACSWTWKALSGLDLFTFLEEMNKGTT